jgi:Glycosyl transferase family 2
MRLIAHVNGDDDILDAWFKHYLARGVTDFHLIVHGPRSQNKRLFELLADYPIHIEDEYMGEFLSTEKLRRVTSVLDRMREQWIVWVDSDEFVESPYTDLRETARRMERLHSDILLAPFLQRLTADGSLATPEVIDDPFRAFPLGSLDLYAHMGVDAASEKHPLFYCATSTVLTDGGNHGLPYGYRGRPAPFRGVTHHFKWRRTVRDRIESRANSSHPWRQESAGFSAYLTAHEWRLPLDGAFRSSTAELRERGLVGPTSRKVYAVRWALSRLPESVDDRIMEARRTLFRRS